MNLLLVRLWVHLTAYHALFPMDLFLCSLFVQRFSCSTLTHRKQSDCLSSQLHSLQQQSSLVFRNLLLEELSSTRYHFHHDSLFRLLTHWHVSQNLYYQLLMVQYLWFATEILQKKSQFCYHFPHQTRVMNSHHQSLVFPSETVRSHHLSTLTIETHFLLTGLLLKVSGYTGSSPPSPSQTSHLP